MSQPWQSCQTQAKTQKQPKPKLPNLAHKARVITTKLFSNTIEVNGERSATKWFRLYTVQGNSLQRLNSDLNLKLYHNF